MKGVSSINDVITFNDRFSMVKGLILLKLWAENIVLPNNDINILTLFVFNINKEEVLKEALTKEYIHSIASGENKVSVLIKKGFLDKIGISKRSINKKYFINIDTPYITATYKIHNIINAAV